MSYINYQHYEKLPNKNSNELLRLKNKVIEYEKELLEGPKWIWVDSFDSVWYDDKYIESIKNKGYKIVLVSPELHNRTNKLDYEKIKSMINKKLVDAICTDAPDRWK